MEIYRYPVGPGFIETYGMDVLAGRSFSDDRPQDQYRIPTAESPRTTAAFVVNAALARQFGWTPEQALGKQVQGADSGGIVSGPIIGVVDDAYLESTREAIKPILFEMPPEYRSGTSPNYYLLSVSIGTNDLAGTLAYIEETWNRFNPDSEMRLDFLDQEFNVLYRAEQRQGRLFLAFSLLAILLACCGLFGLAAFNAERRTKEIGVRKVMGGSVWSIVLLLTREFSRLVLLANLLAWPLAYVAMSVWLESFAYRIDLTPLVFIGSGAVALCIAWVTVGGTAAKAASAKPVLALRYE